MKKSISLFLVILFLAGCAAPQHRTVQPVDHPKLPAVRQMVGELAHENGLDPQKIYVAIIEDNAINAWIDDRPIMFITTALIEAVPDDDSLKCVLAHELSHYALNHIAKSQATSIGVSAVFQVADIFVPGLGLLNLLANPTITSSYGRANELEADATAVLMCEQAGMVDARDKMITMLAWLGAQRKGNQQQVSLWSTHPSIEDRINNLKN
jgi:Zn-dependent protease with chaperone function